MISVVIPIREGGNAETTLRSLAHQTFKNLTIILSHDEGHGASWARNRGFERVTTPFVLFSDDDIDWKSDAMENLFETLDSSVAGYSYGHVVLNGEVCGDKDFDGEALREANYISTMSLIRSEDFKNIRFDEKFPRFQDWDLWLSMYEKGIHGIHCPHVVCETEYREGGISWGNYNDALEMLLTKHNIDYEDTKFKYM